jgi:hypothetical protein
MLLPISRKEFPLRQFQMFVKLTLTYQPFYSPNTHKVLWWNNEAHFLLTAATSPTVQSLNRCDLPSFGISRLYDLFSFCFVPYSCDRALPTFSHCYFSSLWNFPYVISPRPINAICTLHSVWTLMWMFVLRFTLPVVVGIPTTEGIRPAKRPNGSHVQTSTTLHPIMLK